MQLADVISASLLFEDETSSIINQTTKTNRLHQMSNMIQRHTSLQAKNQK